MVETSATLGLAILETRVFHSWLGWAFIISAAANLVALYLPVAAWDAVTGLPFLWVLVMSIQMLLRPARYAEAR